MTIGAIRVLSRRARVGDWWAQCELRAVVGARQAMATGAAPVICGCCGTAQQGRTWSQVFAVIREPVEPDLAQVLLVCDRCTTAYPSTLALAEHIAGRCDMDLVPVGRA
jgi:hypothetical protein